MTTLELVCLGIVALYVVPRVRMSDEPDRVGFRLAWIAIAAWAGEASCIRAYHFYAYTPDRWSLLPGDVPVLVPLIWPVVIHSAWDLARRLIPDQGSLPMRVGLVGLVVLTDASLIEPIAVHADLWVWGPPGLFGVPPVGVIGWGIFAALVALALEVDERTEEPRTLLILLAPLALHPLLLAVWWGALRWISYPIPTVPAVALLWIGVVVLAGWLLKVRPPDARGPTLARGPGALFFFGLLAVYPPSPLLLAWAAAFAMPYVVLLAGRRRA